MQKAEDMTFLTRPFRILALALAAQLAVAPSYAQAPNQMPPTGVSFITLKAHDIPLTADLPGERRWRIEHAQIVDPLDIPRFQQLGVVASMQPIHQPSDRLMAEARLGPERLKGAYAWRSMEKAGVRLAFGSDVPVESANPFPGIAAAISRTDARGEPFGGWRPEETVSRESALDGFTRTAAYAAFAEDRIGTLMPGMRADFLILESDPLLASADEIRRMTPLETWIGGYRYYKKNEGATVGR